ncbi:MULTISPECIES: Cro/CI family transcriptional regulator [unclassified Methylobacterium]|uniref:transcriptional regulator n=1 Tax=unclassified Methylobacterium TaxID=2615210 RepID=UPI0009E96833|nr:MULTISPECIES: Cro/CI family transcriptional regulator [unclassified Methylobacterium]
MSEAALKKAIELAGGHAALARSLGISSAAISQWQSCPPLRVLKVEAASGVPRHELRPDLYQSPASGMVGPSEVSVA